MISDDSEKNYAFWDYLHRGIEGGNTRDSLEFQWHKERQAPSKHTYNPTKSEIDFQGPTWNEFHDNN